MQGQGQCIKCVRTNSFQTNRRVKSLHNLPRRACQGGKTCRLSFRFDLSTSDLPAGTCVAAWSTGNSRICRDRWKMPQSSRRRACSSCSGHRASSSPSSVSAMPSRSRSCRCGSPRWWRCLASPSLSRGRNGRARPASCTAPRPASWCTGSISAGCSLRSRTGSPPGLAALIVSLQPVLTSTIANRWLGERVLARQWFGLALGLLGVYLDPAREDGVGRRDAVRLAGGDRGAARHHRRHALSEALRRRQGLAAGFIHSVFGGRDPVCVQRVCLRNPRRALDAAISARARLAGRSGCRSARSGSTTT